MTVKLVEGAMASVRKRIRIGADGQEKVAWVADYFDQKHERHLKTFRTQKAAKAWLVEALGEVARGVHTPERQSINIFEAAQLWLERGQTEDLEKSTLRGYEAIVRLHICPDEGGIGAIKLAQLSTPMLETWRDRLVTKLSRSLARKVLGTLKSILSEAHRRGLVAQNAALPVRVDTKKREFPEAWGRSRYSEQSRYQKAAGRGSRTAASRFDRDRDLYRHARERAPRPAVVGEKTVTVRQRADEWGTIAMPKSHAGQRKIPMSSTVLNTLREWRLACSKGELDLVFPNTLGKVQPLSNISHRMWRPLQRKAGLVDDEGRPLFNFHTLRHFTASNWIELGFSPKRLQTLLGHSSVQMTFDRYGHLFPSAEDDHEKFARGEIGLIV